MTTLLESVQTLFLSDNRRRFILSIIAVFIWIMAITLTILSGSFAIPFGDYIITVLLAFSALMAMISTPRIASAANSENPEPDTGHPANH